MKSIEIRASLPFSWCRFCFRMDMKTEIWITNGQMEEIVNVCANAPICQACERAWVSEKLEKEDPFCEGVHGDRYEPGSREEGGCEG